MTDERRQDDRRGEDVRLAEQASELYALLEEERKRNGKWFAPIDHGHEQLDQIVELLEGTDGNVLRGIPARKGMADMVNEMWKHQQGGWIVYVPIWLKIAGLVLAVSQIILTVMLIAGNVG